MGNLSPAHVQEEKDDVSAEDEETFGGDSERFAVSAGGFVLAPGATTAPSCGKEYKSPWAVAPGMIAEAGNVESSPQHSHK